MPSLQEFPSIINKHAFSVVSTAVNGLKSSAKAGSDFMMDVIFEGASTGTAWHREKNELNDYEPGARVGSRVRVGRYGPSSNPGQMLASVGVTEPTQSGQSVTVRFGWVKTQEGYFVQQDTGSYAKDGVGMGLLNEVDSGQGLSAFLHAESHLIKLMKSAQFKVSGGALS
jgi:hypothetical protein